MEGNRDVGAELLHILLQPAIYFLHFGEHVERRRSIDNSTTNALH
jgi:hypothetical protein